MPIVTISHEIGAGGPEIGQQLADRLGYRYVDHELISDAAQRYGLLEEKLSHRDDSKPSLFERFDAETRRYITVIQTALYDFAEHDNVVLMGRGGQWLLRGIPHVLRVRVMAPFDVRVKRLGKKLAGPMGEQTNPRTVTELVRRDDAEKAGRMRYLYEVGITDPALYDLVINTEQLSVAAAGVRSARGRSLSGLPRPGGARHASRDAALPHYGGGAERRRDPRRQRSHGRGDRCGTRGGRGARREGAADGHAADPALRCLETRA